MHVIPVSAKPKTGTQPAANAVGDELAKSWSDGN
jgi:hypothetical protein